jgi:hypothetical protein
VSAVLQLLPREIQRPAFNECVDALVRKFERHHGSISRQCFRNTCYEHGVLAEHAQAYFEMVGLRVTVLDRSRTRSPMDRFEWRAQ